MKTMKVYFPSLLIILIFLSSCSTDEIDTPTGVKIRFQAKSTVKNAPDSIVIMEAYIAIAEINFIHAGNADTSGTRKIVHYGPYIVDVVRGTISPAVRRIFIDPGVYDQISLTSNNSLPGNYSLIIKGLIKPADQTELLPFEIHAADAFDLKINNAKGIQIRNNETLNLLIEIDLLRLFSDLDFQKSTDGKQNLLLLPHNLNGIINNMTISRISQFSTFKIDDGKIIPNISDDETKDEEGKENGSGDTGNEDRGTGQEDNSTGSNSGSGSDSNNNSDNDDDDEPNDVDNQEEQQENGNSSSSGGNNDDKDDDKDSDDNSKDNNSGNPGNAPGMGDENEGPGNSGNVPGKGNSDNKPGNSGNAPGNNKNDSGPGSSGNAPGNANGSNGNNGGK